MYHKAKKALIFP